VAKIALASYCGNSLVNSSWDCYWCKQTPGFRFVTSWNNPSSHIFGFAGIKNNMIYVAWRGTVLTDILNWANNFKFTQVPYPDVPGAAVHSGFFGEYNSIRNASIEGIKKAISICPNCEITVTGHYLGGALCIFSALDVARITRAPLTLTTLSSPRVGNVPFKTYVESKIASSKRWRVVNKADLVPHVPPRAFTYEHIGSEAWEKKSNQFVYCADGESKQCSDQLVPLFNPFDHAVIMGLDALSGLNNHCLADINNKMMGDDLKLTIDLNSS